MDFGYFSTDMAFQISSPVNVVKQLFYTRDDMGPLGCDTDDLSFSPSLGYQDMQS